MSKLLSNEGYIGLAKQTSKGNPASTSLFFVKYLDGSFKTEQATSPLREGGDGETVSTVIKTSHKEKFSFKANCRPEVVAYVLAYLMGEDTKSGSSDPYTHVITRGSSRIWCTIFRKLTTDDVQRIEDCKISKVTIEGEAGKEVTLSVEGEGCGATLLSSDESEVYETGLSVFKFYDGAGKFDLGGTITKNIKKFSVSIAVTGEGLMTDELVPGDIPDLQYNVDVALDLYVDSTANWKKANYNSGTSPDGDVYQDSLTIDLNFTDSVTSTNRQLKIEVPSFVWNSIDLPMKGAPDVLTETVAGIALKTTGVELITVTLQNDLSDDLAGSGS